jgi:tetratricopeptide (TPR) repeat protein
MRYYGLYAWLSLTYAKEIGDTDPEEWKRIVRRAEALYALIASHHGNETGVAGTDWAQRTFDALKGDTIHFAEAAEPGSETYYLKQPWGAFGAAYRSQLFEIGIYDPSDAHEIPLPSKPLGEGLALAFAESLGDLASLYFEIIRRGSVNTQELGHLAPILPSAIGAESAERTYYEDILLPKSEAPEARALSRSLSIRLILKITELIGREPRADDIRWVLYGGCDREGQPLLLDDPALEAQRFRWWVYHANDLCHIAHEALLKFTLDTLGNYQSGISLARLIAECAEAVSGAIGQESENWSTFLAATTPAANASDIHDPDSEAALASEIIRAGRSDQSVCTPETAACTIRLLAILHRRIAPPARAGMEEDCVQDRDLDLQINGCTAVIRSGHYSGKNLAIAYYNRGTPYLRLAEYARAIKDYDEALRLDPGHRSRASPSLAQHGPSACGERQLRPQCRHPAGRNAALCMNGSNWEAALRHRVGLAKSAKGRDYPSLGLGRNCRFALQRIRTPDPERASGSALELLTF